MAFCASSSVDISTKPKPRERPVARSVITVAVLQVPACENSSLSSSLVVLKERLPTNNLVPIVSPRPHAGRSLPTAVGGTTWIVRAPPPAAELAESRALERIFLEYSREAMPRANGASGASARRSFLLLRHRDRVG